MPIRVKLTLNLTLLQAAEDFAERLPKTVQEVGRPIVDKLVAPLLADLGRYPSPPDYPIGKFPWKSERQRRFVLAKLKGKRYRRSFAMRRAWRVEPKATENALVLIVTNLAEMARYVVGKLNQRSRNEAILPIQPFHAPRWRPAVDIVAPYFQRARVEFDKEIARRYDGALRVKATRRSRF